MDQLPRPDYEALIPEMRDWNNGAGIDINSWIGCAGNFSLAIGYSTIFWPRFVEFEGYILNEGFDLPSLRTFEGRSGATRYSVEWVMNHLHIADIQYYNCDDITQEKIVYLGRLLQEIYRVKLAWQFPRRKMNVEFYEPEDGELLEYQLSFYQQPPAEVPDTLGQI